MNTTRLSLCALACVLAITCVAGDWVVKSQLSSVPAAWTKQQRARPDTRVVMHWFVKQTNTAALEDLFWKVSNPRHPSYGQYLTLKQVNRMIAPEPMAIMRVVEYLTAHGVRAPTDLSFTSNGDILVVDTTVGVAEALLNTEYYFYTHTNGARIMRAESYSLPQQISKHVDFVGPTVRFPVLRNSNNRTHPNVPNDGVTPDFLRKLYSVGSAQCSPANNNLQGVASFLEQYMDYDDLESFFQQFNPSAYGQKPKIIGPNDPTNPGIEAMLDIEYIMSMGSNCTTQFWSTPGTQPHNPENEPFLVWLFNVTNTTNPPLTFSVSYGDNEDTVDYDYAVRVNVEFQKAGIRGLSIMASSGDGGVSGSQPSDCTQFIPTFPAASPYVTAVGGSTSYSPEVASSLSAGGFSNRWARPSYQESAVANYFAVAQNLPPSNLYNQTGAGFPDVAAQAEGFNIVVDGFPQPVDGTSCSSPTFTGIITLLNELRLSQGKPSLGYLNQLFYQNPSIFTDIVDGDNPGCNTNGFQAAAGWDPITGLGTPNYEKMAALVSSLP